MKSTKESLRNAGPWLAAASLVSALGVLAPALAGRLSPEVYFNFGPNDDTYLEGFEDRWEIDPDGLATHWSTYESAVALPLRADGGPFELTYRFSRVYGETARIEVLVNGVLADRFFARGGAYHERSRTIPASVLGSGPFRLEIRADSHEGANRGLRLDWFRLRAKTSRGRVVPELSVWAWSGALSLAFGVLLALSLPSRGAIPSSLGLPIMLVAYGGWAGPFPLAHVLGAVAPAALALIAVAALSTRWTRRHGLSWIAVLTIGAFLVRAAGVFHPLFYHPDLRSHADLAALVARAGLDFWSRPLSYITEQGVWTQAVMGRTYAFPFSPVFHALFVPFDLDFFQTVAAMKLSGALLSALEVPVVFYLGLRLRGIETGRWAAALIAVSPAAFSRLSFAFLAALFAHFLDTLVLAVMASRSGEGRLGPWWTFPLLAVALGSYPGSLVSFGLFVPFLGMALLVGRPPTLRREGALLLAGGATTALVVMGVVYREFLVVFVSEILPSMSARATSPSSGLAAFGALLVTRFWIFYDGVYLPLFLGGSLIWFRHRPRPFSKRFLLAWVLSFLSLIVLRAVEPELFNKVKEILWIAPVIALASGEALAWLARRLPSGNWAAGACYAVLVYYGVSLYATAIVEKFPLAR